MPGSTRRVYRFGAFELFTAPAVLSRNGEMVSITPKALATLTALVLNQGKPLSKDELLTKVWAGTAVEEANLSQNIYTLRKLLAPDFPGQTIIENIPRLGYRFTLPVEEEDLSGSVPRVSDPSKTVLPEIETTTGDTLLQETVPVPVVPLANTQTSDETQGSQVAARQSRRPLWMAFVAVGLCLAVLLYWQWPLLAAHINQQPKYEWTRLTANDDENRVTAASLAPDGNLVAYADADGVILRGAQDAAIHLLPSPKLKVIDDLSWFPDQLHLIVSGESADSGKQQLWKVSVLGEAPVLLRDNARLGEVSHDGASVAFLAADSSAAWVMGTSGENARQVVSSGSGQRFTVLLWDVHDKGFILESRPILPPDREVDAGGNALAFSEGSAYERVNLSDGKKTAEVPGVSMGDACLLDDETLIYSLSTPLEGRESPYLWRTRLDAETGAMLSKPVMTYSSPDYNHMYGFNCSGDGKRILVLRKQGAASVYVGDFDAAAHRIDDVRKLSTGANVARPHGWSSDSSTVFYSASGLNDHWKIYSQSLSRHDPDLAVAMSGSYSTPTFTPDHQWMFFKHQDVLYGPSTLYRVSMVDRSPSPIPAQENITDVRCPLTQGACVVQTPKGKDETDFSILDPVSGKGKVLATLPMDSNSVVEWDISPDGSTIVFATAPGFPLHTISLATGKVENVAFQSLNSLLSVTWTADGKGFFVTSTAGSLTDLFFVDTSGKATLLRTTAISSMVVPSPNGKRVAFIDRSLDSNVWLFQQQ